MIERRILLAENDPRQAAILKELLSSLYYSVEVHTDGLTALQRLKEPEAPEMVLLDSSLSPMTGLEIALEIRRRSRRRHMWLMLMSDRPSKEEIVMATDAGIDEFLIKPIDSQELKMRIRTGERVQEFYREMSDSAMAMEFHSTHDPLTGTWRREAMLDFVFKETDRAQRLRSPLSVMLIDIDRFSAINAKAGHNCGDKLLKAVAGRLRRQLRSYDMLGRYAADEFMLAFPGCESKDAEAKAERIRTVIEKKPFMIDGAEFSLTVSIGVASSAGRSPLIVLREAERALSLAKQQGQNAVCFFSEINPQSTVLPEIRRYHPENL